MTATTLFKGADTDRLAELERELNQLIARYETALDRDNHFTRQLASIWLGPFATTFLHTWTTIDRATLATARSGLTELRERVTANRTEQDITSQADSTSGGGAFAGVNNTTDEGGGWGFSDFGHLGLDVIGLVPVVGNAADAANAAWYAAEGEYLDAALSALALIPVIGQGVIFAKGAIKAAAKGKVFKSVDEATAWAKKWLDDAGILGKSSDDAASGGRHVDSAAGGEFVDDAIRAPGAPRAQNTGIADDVLKLGEPDIAHLPAPDRRSVRSYQKRIREHEQKLADYIADPDSLDNAGHLANAPTSTIRQKVIDQRIAHLRGEITTFSDNVRKIMD